MPHAAGPTPLSSGLVVWMPATARHVAVVVCIVSCTLLYVWHAERAQPAAVVTPSLPAPALDHWCGQWPPAGAAARQSRRRSTVLGWSCQGFTQRLEAPAAESTLEACASWCDRVAPSGRHESSRWCCSWTPARRGARCTWSDGFAVLGELPARGLQATAVPRAYGLCDRPRGFVRVPGGCKPGAGSMGRQRAASLEECATACRAAGRCRYIGYHGRRALWNTTSCELHRRCVPESAANALRVHGWVAFRQDAREEARWRAASEEAAAALVEGRAPLPEAAAAAAGGEVHLARGSVEAQAGDTLESSFAVASTAVAVVASRRRSEGDSGDSCDLAHHVRARAPDAAGKGTCAEVCTPPQLVAELEHVQLQPGRCMDLGCTASAGLVTLWGLRAHLYRCTVSRPRDMVPTDASALQSSSWDSVSATTCFRLANNAFGQCPSAATWRPDASGSAEGDCCFPRGQYA